jgi:hypothetical protein
MAHLPTPEPKDQLEAILERALTAYHRDERHGGAKWIDERVLDTELVPVTREAFRDADALPSDEEVLRTFEGPLQLLGEGYHVIALIEPTTPVRREVREAPRPCTAAGAAQARFSAGVAPRTRRAAGRIAAPGHLAAHPRIRSIWSAGRAQPHLHRGRHARVVVR